MFQIRNGVVIGHNEWAGCPVWVPFFFDYAENQSFDFVETNTYGETVYVFDVEEFAPEWPELSVYKYVKIWREKRGGLPRFLAIAKR